MGSKRGPPLSRAGQASIAAVLSELEALSRAALAARWQHRFGVAAPRAVGRGMLLQGLAYDAQRRRWCGLSARTCRQLAQIAQDHARGGSAPQQLAAMAAAPPPGTRLVRVWRGVQHIVDVEGRSDYRWQGQRYRSLSHIARGEPPSTAPQLRKTKRIVTNGDVLPNRTT